MIRLGSKSKVFFASYCVRVRFYGTNTIARHAYIPNKLPVNSNQPQEMCDKCTQKIVK